MTEWDQYKTPLDGLRYVTQKQARITKTILDSLDSLVARVKSSFLFSSFTYPWLIK